MMNHKPELGRVRRLLSGARTPLLFQHLLRRLQPDVVLDIGARDATESLRFREALPNARLIAIEANPDLARKMQQDAKLSEARIEALNLAVSDRSGVARFNIHNETKGQGSLHGRGGEAVRQVEVPTARLDEVIHDHECRRIALWVDTEGHGHAVLLGAGKLLSKVVCVHLELERQPIFDGQRLYDESVRFLEDNGFAWIGMSRVSRIGVANYVFVKEGLNKPALIISYLLVRLYARVAHAVEKSGLYARFPGPFRMARSLMRRVLLT